MKESVLRLEPDGSRFGVLSEPDDGERASGRLAVVLLNSGIVHRVGPNRLYVQMARSLARGGVTALRFDFSGIGDSGPRADGLPIERSAELETVEVLDTLAERGFERFSLLGLCSGAGFAFRAARRDPRVRGVALINAAGHRWGTRRELDQTMARHYLRIATRGSFRRKSLAKILRARFDIGRFVRVLGSHMKLASFRRGEPASAGVGREMRELIQRGTHVLMVYSEGDEGVDYFEAFLGEELVGLDEGGSFALEIVSGANHVFSLLESQRRLIDIVTDWAIHQNGSSAPRSDERVGA